MNNLFQLILMASLLFAGNVVFAFEYGDPTDNEQAHLEAINRARLNPLVEASRLNLNLFEGTVTGAISENPVQPLSFNKQLLQAARGHSEDMLAQDFFAHENLEGNSPFDRMRINGYNFQTAGENIAFRGSTDPIDKTLIALALHDDFFIDKDFPERGHRVNILNPDYREIGVGLAFGDFTNNGTTFNAGMITTDFGRQPNSQPILLGVVYEDRNNNQLYDASEGVDAVTIDIVETGATTITASAGGYGMQVTENSDYNITFSHLTRGSITKNIHVNQLNIKLDVLLSEFSGSSQPGIVSQCAIFSNNQLSIPCVTVDNAVFSAQLSVINTNSLQFELKTTQQINPSEINSKQCANYNSETTQVHLPCIEVGKDNYWANLQLITNTPIIFKLDGFGLN